MDKASVQAISPISDYYRGKIVLLTGVTGFIGECILVKLLRVGVKSVYVLIRHRKNMTSQERFEKMLQKPIFEPLRKQRPKFAEDVITISGSLDELELNVSKEDQTMLVDNVDIIIHSAADVRFDVPIATAAIRNIRGTRELLKLARKMKVLENFIHISTAYAFCMLDVIGEDFYRPPFDSDVIIKIAENLNTESDLDALIALCPKIIDPWPNTYTFTKAITEDMVRKYGEYFKITVVKPSIVTATFREPIEGWASNFSGANGAFAGIVGGVLRCLKLKGDSPIDMVFGDYVVNGALAAGYDVSSGQNDTLPIYNIVSSNDYITTFYGMVKDILPLRVNTVPSKALWYPTFNFCHTNISYFICNMTLQVIPAIFYDIGLRIVGRKPQILKLYRQIHSFSDVINFFICNTFVFENKNMKRVCKSMTTADKKIFPCDFSEVSFSDYKDIYIYKGIAATLLNDKSDEATLRRNARKMRWIHYSFLTIFVLCVASFFYMILTKIFL